MQRFLQTRFWAQFKSRHGWTPYFFLLNEHEARQADEFCDCGRDEARLTVLVRTFSLRCMKFSIAYVPMAPEADISTGAEALRSQLASGAEALKNQLASAAEKIRPFLPKNTLYVRFDPAMDFLEREKRDEFVYNFIHLEKKNRVVRKAACDIQPPDTVLLPLSGTEEEILSRMKSKWRYNIRLAQKKGVSVQRFSAGDEGLEAALETFFSLFQQTSERDGVQFHQKSYYQDLFSLAAQHKDGCEPQIRLYLAQHETDFLAGIIVLFCRWEAVYLYGASGNEKRNCMPAYLLQWTAIKDALQSGCPVYDFYGCPPSDDKNHPMHGLFLFKTGFGGTLVHRPGSFDVILKKNAYMVFRAAEQLRSWYHRKFKKLIARRKA